MGGNGLDGSQFDAWTRRRFGLVTSGAAAAGLLGLIGLRDTEAKKKNKNKKKKCRKLGQSCDQTQKEKKCCKNSQLCAQVQHKGGGNFCCKQRGQGCGKDEDCCGSDTCGNNDTCEAP